MLFTLAIILLILWAAGLITASVFGGLIHMCCSSW
jgi:hypothetical protein